MKAKKTTYLEFKAALISFINEIMENEDGELEDLLDDDSTEQEILSALESISYSFLSKARLYPWNDPPEADHENIVTEKETWYDTTIMGFQRAFNGETAILGIKYGGDGEIPINAIVYLSEHDEICLFVPKKGNVFNEEENSAWLEGELDEDERNGFRYVDMLEDFQETVQLESSSENK